MAKDQIKAGFKSVRGAVRSRRELMQRERRGLKSLVEGLVRAPEVGWGILIWGLFIVLCAGIAAWTRQQPLIAVGRIANDTAVSRVQFNIVDRVATERERMAQRQRTPWVFVANRSVLEAIGSSIENLPRALGAVEKPEQVIPEVTLQFPGLTEGTLAMIKAEAKDGAVSETWKRKTAAFVDALREHPLITDVDYQRLATEGPKRVELGMDDKSDLLPAGNVINIKDVTQLGEAAREMARRAGFLEPVTGIVAGRLTSPPIAPTYQYDPGATEAHQHAAEVRTPLIKTTINKGDVIYGREKAITQDVLDVYRQELREFQLKAERWRVWIRALSVLGAVTAMAMAMAGYLIMFAPKVRESPARMATIATLLAAALGVACTATVISPALLMLTAIAPTVFVSVILVIAYDRRIALAMGTLHGVLVCVAMDQPIGVYALMLTGISFAVVQLGEIRDRRGIIRMGLYAAAALALGTVLVALIDRPITWPSIQQTITDAGLAGAGGMGVGVLTLALLPAIERRFDITTGMTLIELRDPKQPLLRQLQQRAPGTYNHSLNVASIAEAAADAIKADSLLTYVGSLYHDIGKMNKPEYFVENQVGGPNKHDKLSPAMSLLVIVGHVKDGMALAEEYALPMSLRHFIEAHHGTTLVEYFYNRARRQAEQSAKGEAEPDLPEEIEYRYPGPRPQSKEVAILMLADAVESATRSMAEPTPSRIDALVRALANKRLMDGQFDECELTLRELQTIVESISKSVASIYHGRVLYPSASVEEKPSPERERA